MRDMTDKDVERVLAGRTPEGEAEFDDVARFLLDARSAYPEPSAEPYEAAHVGAMLETARALAAHGTRDADVVSATLRNAAPGRSRWDVAFSRLFAARGPRAVGVAAALVLALGGTAYAGILPAPLQSAAASVARTIGITLPDPASDARGNLEQGSPVTPDGNGSAGAHQGLQGGSNTTGQADVQQGGSGQTSDAGSAGAQQGQGQGAQTAPGGAAPFSSDAGGDSGGGDSGGAAGGSGTAGDGSSDGAAGGN
jgi:hypothetical protein